MKYFLLILTGIVLLSCGTDEKTKALPYIGNYDLEYKLVDGKEVVDTVYPTISYFSFYNEDSIRVTSKDLKGKIWIADFFFTTCSTICPRMTSQMKRLNSMTEDISEHLQFISFSINPNYDGPSQLKKYKAHHGINAKNWVFLTGDEQETHRIGIEEFRIFAGQDDLAEDGYAHSEAFTLVDKKGYVRGVYNIQDPKQVDQMNKDIRKLLEIEYGIK
ncbi:MAG: SCO family protein [Bacteroidetes bacterium]|nr:MAG: SCO family protein [Bacteroidota bacterium]